VLSSNDIPVLHFSVLTEPEICDKPLKNSQESPQSNISMLLFFFLFLAACILYMNSEATHAKPQQNVNFFVALCVRAILIALCCPEPFKHRTDIKNLLTTTVVFESPEHINYPVTFQLQ
jgi:hypothetical protein